ncbi:MAG: endolytic transglycosylase MltG [Bacteroidetes bacterium]|nr:endolytic transglycosylase MltG [Bacteroidota bacterium]
MKKLFIIIGLIGLLTGFVLYYLLFSSNTASIQNKTFVYIPTGSSYEALLKNLEENHIIKNIQSFNRMAKWLGLPDNLHAGKYQVKQGMGNFTIAWMLKGGKQVPVKLVLNKMRTQDDIIRKICSKLEADSNQLRMLFQDTSFLHQYEIDSNQIQALIIPDTYQFYWNTDARSAIQKIAKQFKIFWTDERKQKAITKNMTVVEIITLASIVEEETNMPEDKLLIASTYINRIKLNMPLQADPTVKFALGDFSIKRVKGEHTSVNSTYNTYRNKGLPPGPICTPNTSTIDAVLDAPETKYLYFCAREDLKGYSNFAITYDEHLRNARKYQQALNERGIR